MSKFKVGDMVLLKEGPYKGLTGEVMSACELLGATYLVKPHHYYFEENNILSHTGPWFEKDLKKATKKVVGKRKPQKPANTKDKRGSNWENIAKNAAQKKKLKEQRKRKVKK